MIVCVEIARAFFPVNIYVTGKRLMICVTIITGGNFVSGYFPQIAPD